MSNAERIINAYSESLIEAWLIKAEANYLKIQAKRDGVKKPNINKLLQQLDLDELKRRL